MTTDLSVAIFRRSTFLQVHALEDSILSELLFDGQHGLLHFLFTLKLGVFPFLLRHKNCLVREEIKLHKAVILLRCICYG